MHRHYVHDPDTDAFVEISDRIDRVGWEVRSAAEEGTTPIATVVIDDPGMDFDVVGHRRYMVVEDESESTDTVLWAGYTAEQEIGRTGGDNLEPLGRVWSVSVSDENTVWQRRIMRGSDCKRPEETDVERMQWLLSTAEAEAFDDVTTYVSTADPVDMDACDYRNQMFNGIADDCAQQSGKNWFVTRIGAGTAAELVAWYGADAETDYSSPLSLSNDPDDWTDATLEDGTSLCWPISIDTKLRRDPLRIFSGVVVPYDGGSAYVELEDTALAFARRDTSMPSVNVKTKAKAEARGRRYLRDLDEQDEVVTTTVEVPAALATQLKAGMQIEFKATHLPGLSDFTWCRIVSAAPTPIASGERYRITLELVVPAGPGPAVGTVYSILWYYHGSNGTSYFAGTGDDPPIGYPGRPTTGLVEPVGSTGNWTGFDINGDGTIDIVWQFTTCGVPAGGNTQITWQIQRTRGGTTTNTGVGGSVNVPGGLYYWKYNHLSSGTIDVEAGDYISCMIRCASPVIAFFRAPAGTGNLTHRLEITGGSLS